MSRPGGAQSGSGVDRIGGKLIQFHNVGGWIVGNEEWGLMPSVGVIGSQAINKCVVCLSCHCFTIFDFKLGRHGVCERHRLNRTGSRVSTLCAKRVTCCSNESSCFVGL